MPVVTHLMRDDRSPVNLLAAVSAIIEAHTNMGLNTGSLSLASDTVTVKTKSLPEVSPSAFEALNRNIRS